MRVLWGWGVLLSVVAAASDDCAYRSTDFVPVSHRSTFFSDTGISPQLQDLAFRLTGRPLTRFNKNAAQIQLLFESGQVREAAWALTKDPGFLSSTVWQWAGLLLSSGKRPNRLLDDALAMLIGTVRDNLDARELLTGDYTYGADPRISNLRPSRSENRLYEIIQFSSGKELQLALAKQTPQWNEASVPMAAGILTSRGFATNFLDGTNRHAVTYAFEFFLCQPIELWKTPYLDPQYIRRDITRLPDGNPRVFQTECRSCHAPLDPLSQAFAFVDSKEGTFVYSNKKVRPKYLQHGDVYPEGHQPEDDRWINLLNRPQHREMFGWRTQLEGKGVREFGVMLAQSQAFSSCMVKRVFDSICDRSLDQKGDLAKELAAQFETEDQYGLRNLFVRVAVHPECSKEAKQ